MCALREEEGGREGGRVENFFRNDGAKLLPYDAIKQNTPVQPLHPDYAVPRR